MEGKKKLRTGGPARHRWIFPAAAPLPATQVSSKTSRQQTSLTNPTKSWHALPWNGLLCAKVLFIYWYFFFEEAPQRHSTMNPWTHLVGLLCFFVFFRERTAWPRLAFLQPLFMVKLFWDFHDFNICGPRCPRFPTLRNHWNLPMKHSRIVCNEVLPSALEKVLCGPLQRPNQQNCLKCSLIGARLLLTWRCF